MEGILQGVLLFGLFIVILTALRIVTRHTMRDIRRVRTGDLIWFRIVPEARRSSASITSPEGQVAGIGSFINSLSSSFPYYNRCTVSFVWYKSPNDGMISLYVGMSGQDPSTVRNSMSILSGNINCRIEELDSPPDIPSKGMAVAFRRSNNPNLAADVPSSIGDVAKNLSEAINMNGTFVATIEFMRQSERNKMAANLSEEVIMNVGQSALMGGATAAKAQVISSTAVRASIGAASRDGVFGNSKSLLDHAIGGVSNLGFGHSSQRPSWAHSRLVVGISGVYLAILGMIGYFGALPIREVIMFGLLPAAFLVISLVAPGILTNPWYERSFSRGEMVVPPFFYPSPRRLIHGYIRANYRHDAAGDVKVGNRISPPSCRQMIPLYATSLTQLVSFPAGVMASSVQTEHVPMVGFPPIYESMDDDSVYFGQSGTAQASALGIDDLTFNIFTAGAPGSGKTNFMQVLFAGVSRLSKWNSRGMQITPLWVETKGEGALQAWDIVKNNPKAVLAEAHNPKSEFRIALEGRRMADGASPSEVATNCEAFVSALQFCFGDAIRSESRQVIDFGMRIALFLMPEEIDALEISDIVDRERPNVIELLYLILGGDVARNPAPKLLALKEDLDVHDPRQKYLYEAISTMQPYIDKSHGGFKSAQDRKAPAMNKLTDLRNATELWTPSPDKTDIYIPQIVRNFAPVVLNMGPYWDPDVYDPHTGEYGAYDQRVSLALARRCSLIFSFLVWNFINSKCAGWEAAGRRVLLHYDEVADIAVNSDSEDVPNLIAQIAKQGRSKGCALYAAAQNLAQLPYQARHEVLGFRTKIWYQLLHRDDVADAMSAIGPNTPYTGDNIKNLPLKTGLAIAEMKQGSHITPAFTLKVPEVTKWAALLEESDDLSIAVRSHLSDEVAV